MCVPIVVSNSRSTQQQIDRVVEGLILRVWVADDDLEPESADIEIWSLVDEVHSASPRRVTSPPNYVTWETRICRVKRRLP